MGQKINVACRHRYKLLKLRGELSTNVILRLLRTFAGTSPVKFEKEIENLCLARGKSVTFAGGV